MRVKFLARTKKYGKWQPMEFTITDQNKLENIPEACKEHVKSELNTDYAEVQSIEKIKKQLA